MSLPKAKIASSFAVGHLHDLVLGRGEDDACDECLMGPRPEQDLGGRGIMDLHDDKRNNISLKVGKRHLQRFYRNAGVMGSIGSDLGDKM
ncbi:hypothetical protein AVEN_163748-1 [Araneus ventricosus]|uniref:Uncharacterized protein n=1 Tax=Araneus ventricosus TaxID=182803 RepID=A0A4Y2S4Y6_ARAVE|nr:hypothetical protein AVEN_163748-1 [Araneus ventricosus]